MTPLSRDELAQMLSAAAGYGHSHLGPDCDPIAEHGEQATALMQVLAASGYVIAPPDGRPTRPSLIRAPRRRPHLALRAVRERRPGHPGLLRPRQRVGSLAVRACHRRAPAMTTDRPEAERCPTCGAAVRVVSADEGTSHYEPITDRPEVGEAELAGLRKTPRQLAAILDSYCRAESDGDPIIRVRRDWLQLAIAALRATDHRPDVGGLREAIHRHRDGCNGRPHRRWYRGQNKCDALAALATADKATREDAGLEYEVRQRFDTATPFGPPPHIADPFHDRVVREPAPDDALRTALDELRELSEAATSGPWWGDGPPGGFGTVFVDALTHDERVWLFDVREATAADGAFVAAAVNYVRRALSPAAPEPPEAGR